MTTPDGPAAGWLLVTAAYNEATRLAGLAISLAGQQVLPVNRWVIVDDGSTDGTAEAAESLVDLPFPVTVIRRANAGGLAAASELGAFREGASTGLDLSPDSTMVMKLDADLRLRPDYFAALLKAGPRRDVGMLGGIIEQVDEAAQSHHVRGGLRAYSRPAWELCLNLPIALGWDVLDQVAVRSSGLHVQVIGKARACTERTTGSSVGLLAGRRRLGIACRWTGYHPAYLLLKFARTCLQSPRGTGGLAFLLGYLTAGSGPYDRGLLRAHRREQRTRLYKLVTHPVGSRRRLYRAL